MVSFNRLHEAKNQNKTQNKVRNSESMSIQRTEHILPNLKRSHSNRFSELIYLPHRALYILGVSVHHYSTWLKMQERWAEQRYLWESEVERGKLQAALQEQHQCWPPHSSSSPVWKEFTFWILEMDKGSFLIVYEFFKKILFQTAWFII